MTQTTQPEILTAAASSAENQLTALLHGAGITPLGDIGWVRVTGDDRVRWLNGMVTNSIQDLPPGEGNYNFFLNAQGRIQGDANIFGEPDSLLLQTASSRIPDLLTLLDRFIIMDDVELTDISATRSGLLLAGPQAPTRLAHLNLSAAGLAPLHFRAAIWSNAQISIFRAHGPIVPRLELWADAATIVTLTTALQQAGAVPCDSQSLEWLRLLEGTPRYGTDIRDKELPQETSPNGTQSRALHFSKGCYLGQEIVERIRSRGNVHRTFTSFRLEGALPTAGTLLEADGKQVGELTSAAAIPLSGNPTQLALGYIRREALERNATLTYPGGVATPVSSPVHTAQPSKAARI